MNWSKQPQPCMYMHNKSIQSSQWLRYKAVQRLFSRAQHAEQLHDAPEITAHFMRFGLWGAGSMSLIGTASGSSPPGSCGGQATE